MALAVVEKDPAAELSYTIDWTAWLTGADTVASAAWSVPTGMTNEATNTTGYKATITLSGGTAGSTYDVTCTITTVGGLIDKRTLRFMLVER